MSQNRNALREGAAIQFRNIRALAVRDLMMRYGRDNIGFAWVILEPLLLTVGVMLVWSLVNRGGQHGVPMVEFVLTGYLPLTLWRHMTSCPITIFRRSASLLYHRRVSLFDILAARQIIEFTGSSAAFLVVWGVLYTAGVVSGIARPDLLLVGWFMMAWLALAVGAIIAALTERSETAERFIQPIQYIMLPISGIFFMVDWLPYWAQKIALLNPLVHCYETFRAGYFGETQPTHYDLGYFSICALVFSFIGVLSVQKVRAWVRLN